MHNNTLKMYSRSRATGADCLNWFSIFALQPVKRKTYVHITVGREVYYTFIRERRGREATNTGER